MTIYLVAFFLGVVAGLRSMTVPAAVAWAARLGVLNVAGTAVSFLGNSWVPWLFSVLAVGELVTDQLPATPSRKTPIPFGARIVVGLLAGWVVCISGGNTLAGAAAGGVGAVAGTLGGAAARGKLAAAFGRDRPAALVEDFVAIGTAVLLMATRS